MLFIINGFLNTWSIKLKSVVYIPVVTFYKSKVNMFK